MKKKLLVFTSYVLVSALTATLTLAVVFWQRGGLSKLEQLQELIDYYYIEEADQTVLEDAAAAAMIAATGDRWSYYIPASEYASYIETQENAYVGIGVTITPAEDGSGLQIMEVNPGSSAEEAGMQVNDVIININGHDAAGMTTTGARELVRGREGTTVQITVRREDEIITMPVIRRRIEVAVATGVLLEGNTGLISIANFDDRCTEETVAAIEYLRSQGAEKLIFDIRNNPGGYARELVKLLDYLLPEGDLFRTVDFAGREAVDRSKKDFLDMPMAVLVNRETYSAAEFFAAAMQEYEAAVIVGEKTVGKGRFQSTFTMDDGSAAAISIGKYYTPKGVSLEGVGIMPDVEVSVDEQTFVEIYYGQLAPMEDPQVLAALDALK